MRSTFAALLVAVAATLAGCGETPPAAEPTEQATTAPVVQVAQGTGTVTAIDAAAGAITLDHHAIPEINWPEMVMTFKADPALLTDLRPGDKVGFELTVTDGNREVTALSKE